jgi:Na+-driven multidrug efflux pump
MRSRALYFIVVLICGFVLGLCLPGLGDDAIGRVIGLVVFFIALLVAYLAGFDAALDMERRIKPPRSDLPTDERR